MANLVLTRPIGQSMRLAELLLEQVPGAHLIHLPLLSIIPNESPADTHQLQTLVDAADLAIFVSPNAIECGMRLLQTSWPKSVPIAVVGGGSAEALERRGITADQGYQVFFPKNPEHWDSEGLWRELNQGQVIWQGKNILFLRGSGGREWLSEQFLSQGARTTQFETYRRIPLSKEATAWQSLKQVDANQSACLLTSSEAVHYLAEYLKQQDQLDWGEDWLNFAKIICSHPKIAQTAKNEGFKKVELCSPGDDNLVLASQNWFNSLTS